MVKKTVKTLMSLLILSTIISFDSGINSTADECNDCALIPSTPGDTDYCSISQNNPESKPIIQASSTQIGAGGSISLNVNAESLAYPPYNWSVSNAIYTLDKSTTMSNLEIVTMSAATGSCGNGYSDSNISVTVTVTDACGESNQIMIRNTAGSWGSWIKICGVGNYGSYWSDPINDIQYNVEELGPYYCDYPSTPCNDSCANYVLSNLNGMTFRYEGTENSHRHYECGDNTICGETSILIEKEWVYYAGKWFSWRVRNGSLRVFYRQWGCP